MSAFQRAVETAERIMTAHDMPPAYFHSKGALTLCPVGGADGVTFTRSGGHIIARVNGQIRARSTNGGYVGTVGAREVVER